MLDANLAGREMRGIRLPAERKVCHEDGSRWNDCDGVADRSLWTDQRTGRWRNPPESAAADAGAGEHRVGAYRWAGDWDGSAGTAAGRAAGQDSEQRKPEEVGGTHQ